LAASGCVRKNMPVTNFSPLLGLALPTTGDLSGTWGDTVNDSITSLLDSAISGTTSITVDADTTLTTTDGSSNQARQAVILWNPASGTTTRNITAPAKSKLYTVINASGGTQSIVFKATGQTGVTIVKGESALLAFNGTDFIKVSNTAGSGSFTNLTVSGTTTLSGLTASTALALDASKNVVSVTNTGTGNNVLSASPTLTGTLAAAAANFSGAVALGDAAADNITVNGTVTSNLIFTDNTYDIGASGATRPRNLFLAGNATVGGDIVLTGSLDLTNLEVTNIKAKDGTAGMQIADSTGVVSFTSNPVLTGGTANGVAYLNGSKVLTTGSGLTYVNNGALTLNSPDNAVLVLNATFGAGASILDFTASGSTAQNTRIVGGAGSSSNLSFVTSGSEQMRLTSTGLGIGTSSPSFKLDVNGGLSAVRTNGTTGSQVTYSVNGTETAIAYVDATQHILGSSTAIPVIFRTQGTEKMRLDSSGNLGLGVTPSAWTTFGSIFQGIGYALAGFSSGSNVQSALFCNSFFNGSNHIYRTTAAASEYLQISGQHQWFNAPSGTAGDAISFSQVMTLDASGNLGIGTSSPSEKLTVAGNVTIPSNNFYKMGTGNYLYSDGANTVELAAGTSGKLSFVTNGALRATLDSSGNLGLGVTPSAWGSGFKSFDVGNASFAATGNDSYQGANWFYTGAAYVYKATGFASQYIQGSGAHLWFTAASGTAGNAISFSQVMTLDASGQLMVGGTNPDGQFTVDNATTPYMSIRRAGSTVLFLGSANTLVSGGSTADGAIRTSSNLVFATGGSTERARITSGGDLLVGDTSQVALERLNVTTGNATGMVVKNAGGATYSPIYSWNATTTGDGYFAAFFTETSASFRGSITYNRAAGLTSYNTTSDYRAKDISGPVTDSGALIDSTPVYMGKMKGATQERPMFIAHEVPAYAHTGVKDAVDADGNPVYQQMDASALIPVMWAEIQSLRARVAQLETN
jgi:hypothetical protein